jgi:hypothetical protein
MRDDDDMKPRFSHAEMKSMRLVKVEKDGRENHGELPASWSNSKQAAVDPTKLCESCQNSRFLDRKGFATNRKMAKEIDKIFKKYKKIDKDGSHFVLGWRLYGNKDHVRFQEADGCGCGCGDIAPLNHPKPRKKKASPKKSRR